MQLIRLSIFSTLFGPAVMALDCPGLFNKSKTLISGLNPYVADIHPAGVNFSTPDPSPSYPDPVPDLPEFCRFGAEFNTSTASKVRFEVWLPTLDRWNGRFAFVGNGGCAGGVVYPGMAVPLSKYGFAVASTDTGHNGSTLDCSFMMNNPESQIDFGYRAVHLSTMFAKKIVKAYYDQGPKYNYWIGCSSGGRQGMKSAQMYPEDFDGIVAGAAAQWWSSQNGWLVHVNLLNSNSTTPGVIIPNASPAALSQEVLAQCDKLDGVADGIITDPRRCKPDLSRAACGSPSLSAYFNESTCFSESQLLALKGLYSNWTSDSGELLSTTVEPGSEANWRAGWAAIVNNVNFTGASDFFAYLVLNKTTEYTLSPRNINETELQRLQVIGDATNPGQLNAIDPDLKPFFDRGGKLLQFHGFADPVVPPGSSSRYYERVRNYFKGRDISQSYRLFMAPGLGHCSGGAGADSFGGPVQRSVSQGSAGQSLSFDAQHDMILATMRWVEKGVAPRSIVSAKYIDGDRAKGTLFTRLLCPYPQTGVYKGGDINNATSYACKYE